MASQSSSNFKSTLPQGFSVYQPALGAQLQFFPALGTPELDDMVNAYVPGAASMKEKRTSVSLDFFEHTRSTGHRFKFYPVSVSSPATTASPASVSSRSTSSTQSRKQPRSGGSSARIHPTTDFSHLPGMKILTMDGLDITNSVSRGSKTKEQRDHAHLMRIIKACDTCRRKKVRCDPSHKKRPAAQAQTQSAAKPAKKARTTSPKPSSASTPIVDDSFWTSASPFSSEPTFSFAGLETLDNPAQGRESWEELLQFPAEMEEDYNFFDTESYLSSQTPSTPSSSETPQKSLTPTSTQDSWGALSLEHWAIDGLESPPQLPYLDPSGSTTNYTDFNLFSPDSSTFLEDELMVTISSNRCLVPVELPSDSANARSDVGDMTDRSRDWSTLSSLDAGIGLGLGAMQWHDPCSSPGLRPSPECGAPPRPAQSLDSSPPHGGTAAVQESPGYAGAVYPIETENVSRAVTVTTIVEVHTLQNSAQRLPSGILGDGGLLVGSQVVESVSTTQGQWNIGGQMWSSEDVMRDLVRIGQTSHTDQSIVRDELGEMIYQSGGESHGGNDSASCPEGRRPAQESIDERDAQFASVVSDAASTGGADVASHTRFRGVQATTTTAEKVGRPVDRSAASSIEGSSSVCQGVYGRTQETAGYAQGDSSVFHKAFTLAAVFLPLMMMANWSTIASVLIDPWFLYAATMATFTLTSLAGCVSPAWSGAGVAKPGSPARRCDKHSQHIRSCEKHAGNIRRCSKRSGDSLDAWEGFLDEWMFTLSTIRRIASHLMG